jgi:hypothetical protein
VPWPTSSASTRFAPPRAAAFHIEDYQETLRGHRILHLVGKGNKPATMPVTVPVLRVLEACRRQRTHGPLILRPISGKPIDRRDVYRMVVRIAKTAGIPRHISPHSLRHAAITNALDAGVPLRDAQILARHRPTHHRALRPRPRRRTSRRAASTTGSCRSRTADSRTLPSAVSRSTHDVDSLSSPRSGIQPATRRCYDAAKDATSARDTCPLLVISWPAGVL